MSTIAAVVLEWDAIAVILSVVCAAIGAGTVYLRMFIRAELLEMEKVILARVSKSFESSKTAALKSQITNEKIESLQDDVSQIFRKIEERR